MHALSAMNNIPLVCNMDKIATVNESFIGARLTEKCTIQ